MGYDEGVAQRVREVLEGQNRPDDWVEKKMFGGMAFLLRGNMCVGVLNDELVVRVGKENHEDEKNLKKWIGRGLTHALSLPPK